MISNITITKTARLIAAIAAVGTASVSEAITTFNVSLDTSALVGHPSGPFYLDFQLIDGSGIGNGNNTALVSDFQFGGGGADGSATTIGGASGDLTSGITLVDTEFWNELYQAFTPGSWLSFAVTLSANAESGFAPDMFSFSILDSSLWNIPTQAYDWSDSLLQITLDGPNTFAETFGGDGDYDGIGAPTATAAAVPEGSTYGIGLISLIVLIAARTRFGSRSCLPAAEAA